MWKEVFIDCRSVCLFDSFGTLPKESHEGTLAKSTLCLFQGCFLRIIQLSVLVHIEKHKIWPKSLSLPFAELGGQAPSWPSTEPPLSQWWFHFSTVLFAWRPNSVFQNMWPILDILRQIQAQNQNGEVKEIKNSLKKIVAEWAGGLRVWGRKGQPFLRKRYALFSGQGGDCDRVRRTVKTKLACGSPTQEMRLSSYKMSMLFRGNLGREL